MVRVRRGCAGERGAARGARTLLSRVLLRTPPTPLPQASSRGTHEVPLPSAGQLESALSGRSSILSWDMSNTCASASHTRSCTAARVAQIAATDCTAVPTAWSVQAQRAAACPPRSDLQHNTMQTRAAFRRAQRQHPAATLNTTQPSGANVTSP